MRRVLIIGDDSYIGIKIKAWLDIFSTEYKTGIVSSRDGRWKTEADFSQYETVVNLAGLAHINNITEEMRSMPSTATCRLLSANGRRNMV
mgnify:CR=1 FL=1